MTIEIKDAKWTITKLASSDVPKALTGVEVALSPVRSILGRNAMVGVTDAMDELWGAVRERERITKDERDRLLKRVETQEEDLRSVVFAAGVVLDELERRNKKSGRPFPGDFEVVVDIIRSFVGFGKPVSDCEGSSMPEAGL